MSNDVMKFYPSTDIYALGATLYKLLSGVTPPNAVNLASGVTELKPLPASVSHNVRNAVLQSMQMKKNARPQNIDEFLKLLDAPQVTVAEVVDDEETHVLVSGSYGAKNTNSEAYRKYGRAAEQGDASAQYSLGWCYYKGKGVPQDYYEAVKWYRKAAEQGHADAQCWMGFCYEKGQGVSKDYNEAIKWYKQTARQGNKLAKDKLHDMGVYSW